VPDSGVAFFDLSVVLCFSQLEACTIYACARSPSVQAATAESAPTGLSAPTVVALNSSSINVMWTAPAQPNGIVVSYELSRVAWVPCTYVCYWFV
jgi:usherin